MSQQMTLGKYGKTKRATVTLPVGLLDLVDQAIAARKASGRWNTATTRSGVVADLITVGLADLNAKRIADGDEPLSYDHPGDAWTTARTVTP